MPGNGSGDRSPKSKCSFNSAAGEGLANILQHAGIDDAEANAIQHQPLPIRNVFSIRWRYASRGHGVFAHPQERPRTKRFTSAPGQQCRSPVVCTMSAYAMIADELLERANRRVGPCGDIIPRRPDQRGAAPNSIPLTPVDEWVQKHGFLLHGPGLIL